MKRETGKHPDQLEAVGQKRLIQDLGPREVPKRREPKPDKGTDGLPLFEQEDERQFGAFEQWTQTRTIGAEWAIAQIKTTH